MEEDWRLCGQERYLMDKELYLKERLSEGIPVLHHQKETAVKKTSAGNDCRRILLSIVYIGFRSPQ